MGVLKNFLIKIFNCFINCSYVKKTVLALKKQVDIGKLRLFLSQYRNDGSPLSSVSNDCYIKRLETYS